MTSVSFFLLTAMENKINVGFKVDMVNIIGDMKNLNRILPHLCTLLNYYF